MPFCLKHILSLSLTDKLLVIDKCVIQISITFNTFPGMEIAILIILSFFFNSRFFISNWKENIDKTDVSDE